MHILFLAVFIFINSWSIVNAQYEPNGPQDLQDVVTGKQVTLKWTDKSDIEYGFRVERKVGEDAWKPLVTLGKDTVTYTDNIPFGHICYRVYAFAPAVSPFSNEACADFPAPTTAPDAPTNVSLDGNMVLKWSPSYGALGYHVVCTVDGLMLKTVGETPPYLTAYHVGAFVRTQNPTCFVKAWNLNGVSDNSNMAK